MKKFLFSIFIIMFVISNCNICYCKYAYIFEENVIKLTRDDVPPKCTVSYSTQEWTNENVIVTIEADKEIEQTSGFELSNDRKKLSKISYVSESNTAIVKDLSGNYTEVEYAVNNIDKGPPQIIGVDNNNEYDAPVKLDFCDDTEIKNIFIDRYSDKLAIDYHSEFLDSDVYRNIDRTANSITVHIKDHPLNTKCYKYYINDELYMITNKTCYIYTGLKKGTEYKVKVEALDKEGDVLDSQEIIAKTSFFEIITAQKNENFFSANIINLDENVKRIKYSVNNFYNPSNIKWYEIDSGSNINIKCEKQNNKFYPSYMINVYLYDESGNILDIVQFFIDFAMNYDENNNEADEYNINIPGNYQIKVTDIAENETVYYIKVK